MDYRNNSWMDLQSVREDNCILANGWSLRISRSGRKNPSTGLYTSYLRKLALVDIQS